MDIDWIDQFEQEDKLYEDFYKNSVETIQCVYIYVNDDNNIIHINKENIMLSRPNILPKEQLIYMLKNNKTFEKRTYKLLSILQFNYDLDSYSVLDSIKNDKHSACDLKTHHYIDNIIWNPTVSVLSDLNTLYMVYYYDPANKVKTNTTRKVTINANRNKLTRKHT